MLLYDENYVLFGLTKDTLELLAFESFEDFVNRYNDIDKLLLDKKSKAHFIEEILILNEKSMTYKIKNNGIIEDVLIELEEFYPSYSQSMFYAVNFKIKDDAWLEASLKKINMTQDEYMLYLKEFIKSQSAIKDELKQAISLVDRIKIKKIVRALLEPANTLEITPIVEVLKKLEESSSEEAFKTNYQEFEAKVEKIKSQVF